jgi:hypothetical protein
MKKRSNELRRMTINRIYEMCISDEKIQGVDIYYKGAQLIFDIRHENEDGFDNSTLDYNIEDMVNIVYRKKALENEVKYKDLIDLHLYELITRTGWTRGFILKTHERG